jgi:hypothetical protein
MKKLYKDSLEMTKSGIVLGTGASVVQQAGGSAAGLQTLGNYMPTVASVKGAGLTLRMVKKLK